MRGRGANQGERGGVSNSEGAERGEGGREERGASQRKGSSKQLWGRGKFLAEVAGGDEDYKRADDSQDGEEKTTDVRGAVGGRRRERRGSDRTETEG